ncbi:MAG: molybdopterin-dependent oxidoreductase [Anaerolineae bacterium]|nr:molybdopterin-dependent oxidoreductase [Anaerolineae bacterium]
MKMRTVFLLALGLVVWTGCTGPVSTPVATEAGAALTPTPCVLEPIVVPTPPAVIPPYTELDETTGLHVTGSIPEIDFETYRLEVVGKVGNPLSLSYDDLRCMGRVELRCTLTCPGFFSDEATWAGVPLDHILELAEIESDIFGVKLVSADGYSTLVSPNMLQTSEPFLAYEWEGEPVPMLHGFPVRAIFPDAQGSFWAKWLIKIEVY